MEPRQMVDEIQRALEDLRGKAQLAAVEEGLQELVGGLAEAGDGLRQIRSHGYQYQGTLEAQLVALQNDFNAARPRVAALVAQKRQEGAYRLQNLAALASNALSYVTPGATEAPPPLQSLHAEVERFASEVEQQESACRQPVMAVAEKLRQVKTRIQQVAGAYKLVEEHGVPFEGGEGLVDAVKATWLQEPKKLEGALILTDKRLAFSWAEEVIVEKGWIFNKTKRVFHLKVNEPLAGVQSVSSSEKGLVFKDELLDVATGGAGVVKLKLGADSDTWKATILKVKSGEIQRERVGNVPPPPAPIPAPADAWPASVATAAPGGPAAVATAMPGGSAPYGASPGYPPPAYGAPPTSPGAYPGAGPVAPGWPMPPAAPTPPTPPAWPAAPGMPQYPGAPAPGGYPGQAPAGYVPPGGYAPGVGQPPQAGYPWPGQGQSQGPAQMGPMNPALPTLPGTLLPPGAQGIAAALCSRCGAYLIAPGSHANLQCPQCRTVGSV